MNALQRAIDIAGSQSALARAIGRVPQVINNWVKRGSVSVPGCAAIERAVKGAVTCEELRPDVDWSVFRNTSLLEARTLPVDTSGGELGDGTR